MAKNLKISANQFPSDKNIYDLVMSGNVSLKKLQELLLEKGIVVFDRSASSLSDCLCSLILDNFEIEKLLSFTNVRENRIKTSTIEINAKKISIEQIHEALGKVKIPLSVPDQKIRVLDGLANSTLDKESSEIVLEQKFKRFDYSKTALLQEEDNSFSITISKQSDDDYKLVYSTSHQSSEVYFDVIKAGLKKEIKSLKKVDLYFHEILLSDLPKFEINSFFQELLKNKNLGMSLDHVIKISLTKDPIGSDLELEDTVINEKDETAALKDKKENETEVKNLRLEGINLLEHKHIITYVSEGFVIKNLTGRFYTTTEPSHQHHFEISVGFGNSNKFFSEIHKTTVISNEENASPDKINLTRVEKESYLGPINDCAFEVYEKFRVNKEDSTASKKS